MLRKHTDTSSVRAPLPRPAPLGCPTCGSSVDARSRHVVVEGSSVRVYCSRECKDGALLDDLGLVVEAQPEPGRRRLVLGIAGVGALMVAVGAPVGLWFFTLGSSASPGADAGERIALADVATDAAPADAAPAYYGPAWPPTESEWIDVLARDTWIHPLQGPERRMPIRHSRVFGASRPGDRPPECRSGHCGVDIGGARDWGEPVLAVHDGVVDRVERGPNPQNGGHYVRLSHRRGTVFTEYFHLAAIPRRIRPGRRVKMGEVIGLLGETGVQNSGAHLHFAISVKPAPGMPREFIDPEPLIALWPIKMPVECTEHALVSPLEPPGFVRGAASGPRHHRKRKHTGDATSKGHAEDQPSAPSDGKEAPSRPSAAEGEGSAAAKPVP